MLSVHPYLNFNGDAEEADRVFDALASGGRIELPLAPTDWAEKYGSCVDRFGVQWMVSFTGAVRFQMPPT